MSERKCIGFSALATESSAVLVDMDGCMIASGQPLPGAKDLINLCREHLWLVSNNSSHSADELSHYLRGLGLAIPAQRILLAGELVLEEARARFPDGAAMILARRQLREYARSRGIMETDEKPDVIILTRDVHLDYRRLSLAIKHLSKGVPLLVANPDISHPDIDGDPVPETGSLLAFMKTVLPTLEYEVFGKPAPRLFQCALTQSGANPEDCLMIGDNPHTDCDGAKALGVRPFLIGRHADALAPDIATLLSLSVSI